MTRSFVFIDDEEFWRSIWTVSANAHGIHLHCYDENEKFDTFLKFPMDTVFYIDSELSDKICGMDIASFLFSNGYKHIFIATCHNEETFSSQTILEGVVGKNPPWF